MPDEKALATHEAQPLAHTSGDPFVDFLERAARDPSIDVDKLERLLALKEKQDAQERKRLYFESLARLQARLEPIVKAGENKYTGSRYVRLDDLLATIKPLCEAEGFAFSFNSIPIERGIDFTCEMVHSGGHSESKHLVLPVDTYGDKTGRTAIQAVGSSTTYARRYLLDMHLNLARKGEDDDGSGGARIISAEQVTAIKQSLEELGADAKRFLDYMKVAAFEEISERDLPKARGFVAGLKRGR